MNQYEAADRILLLIPEAAKKLPVPNLSTGAFELIRLFTSCIRRQVLEQDLLALVRSFRLMDRIYDQGDQLLKNAVEQVFVYSLDTVLCCRSCHPESLWSLLPTGLYTAYSNQLCRSGI